MAITLDQLNSAIWEQYAKVMERHLYEAKERQKLENNLFGTVGGITRATNSWWHNAPIVMSLDFIKNEVEEDVQDVNFD